MSDNVTLNPASGGSVVRAVQKGGASGPESQVVILDAGGGGAESLLAAGQQTMSASLPVVIASNQSAVPASQSGTWAVATNADAAVGAGAAPAKALVVGGVYNSTLPTLTNGQTVGVQVDSSGRILVGAVAGTVTVSGALTANQGSAAALSGKWPVQVTDGTNTMPTGDAAARTIHVTVDNATLAVTQSGTWTVATNADAAVGAGAAPSKALAVAGVFNSTLPTLTNGQTAGVQVDSSGRILVGSVAGTVSVSGTVTANQGGAPWSENVTQFGGTNLSTGTGAGGAGVPRVTVSNDSAVKLWDGTTVAAVDATSSGLKVTPVPTTAGGLSKARVKSAASTNATNVKGSAGQVYGMSLYNNTGAAKFLKLYDKATSPTVGTDTPAWTEGIPANGGRVVEFSMGIPFTNGIGYGITGGITDADTTATAADDVHGVLLYR